MEQEIIHKDENTVEIVTTSRSTVTRSDIDEKIAVVQQRIAQAELMLKVCPEDAEQWIKDIVSEKNASAGYLITQLQDELAELEKQLLIFK